MPLFKENKAYWTNLCLLERNHTSTFACQIGAFKGISEGLL